MKFSFLNYKPAPKFKGYDAAPIKRLYLQDEYAKGRYLDDMVAIGNKENFEVETMPDNTKWMQDNKTFVYKNGRPSLVATSESDEITGKAHINANFINLIKLKHNIDTEKNSSYVAGGNMFIGKKENGEKWMLIGEEEPNPNYGFFNKRHKASLSRLYNVKEENIHFIPQQNYHLDTFIRPVGYPYVLVNDPELVVKNLSRLKDDSAEFKLFCRSVEKYANTSLHPRSNCNSTVKALTKAGFKPIRIAGDYCWGVNFMNAIVNKHPDGSLSYITGSSKCASELHSKLQEIFESDLREKLPNLDKIYFVEGKKLYNDDDWVNSMMDIHQHYEAGVHCLALEEPDFEKYA